MVLPAHEEVGKNFATIKNELKSISDVTSATVCMGSPISTNIIFTAMQTKWRWRWRRF